MKTNILWGALALLVGFSACKKEAGDVDSALDIVTKSYVELAAIEQGDYVMHIYAKDELIVGYNELFFGVEDKEGELVTDYTIHAHPMMDMGMMMHTTPHGHAELINEKVGLYQQPFTFIMASTAGVWNLTIDAHIEGEDVTFEYSPTVVEPDEPRLISYVSEIDSASYFIALTSLEEPSIGNNDFVVMAYKKESMNSFPAVEDLIIEIEPEMPSMGHGSPNNVHPVHTMHGEYKGLVNFTMSGYWKVNITVFDADKNQAKTDLSFDITF